MADEGAGAAVEVPVEEPAVKPEGKTTDKKKPKPKRQPPYHVILWNDNDHSYHYVIVMLRALCGHPAEAGYQLAKEVDTRGRAVVMTTTLERAELKRDQIHAYGKDDLIAGCAGSMSATIEPAEV